MQIDSGDDSLADDLSGYTYSDGGLNWEEALNFCENLNYAQSSDWRLPNAKELHSIVDYARSPDYTNSAAIDPVIGDVRSDRGRYERTERRPPATAVIATVHSQHNVPHHGGEQCFGLVWE